jgi:hypothetical protein
MGLFMASFRKSADQSPWFAVDAALKIGHRIFTAFAHGLALERLNKKTAKDRNRERLRAVVVSRTGQRSSS